MMKFSRILIVVGFAAFAAACATGHTGNKSLEEYCSLGDNSQTDICKVNTAGVTRDNLFMRMKDEEWDTVIRVNLEASFRLMRSAVKGMMRRRWGRIIAVTSIVGTTGNAGQGNYAASKAGLVGMSKSLARELNVPIVCLSQLNRAAEQREGNRPRMSDLRESGAIEQDADIILMMYREEYYKQDTQDKGLAEVIIGKHRNGPTGTVKLTFLGQYARFENFASGSGY
jgi:replicative DNA helicase